MQRKMHLRLAMKICLGLLASLAVLCICGGRSYSQEMATLKNGMRFQGYFGKIPHLSTGVNAPAPAGGVSTSQIILVDDQMRRYYFSWNKLNAAPVPVGAASHEIIKIPQRVITAGAQIQKVGRVAWQGNFDEWGRRTCTLAAAGKNRPVTLVMGITQITPIFTQLESIQGGDSIVWSTEIATSSIPHSVLSGIFAHHVRKDNADQRMRLVRLYIQADRIQDASKELQTMLPDFPELDRLKDQVDKLRQLAAQKVLKEIEQRRSAGQHQLVIRLLQNFPQEGVAGELLLQVKEMLDDYDLQNKQAANLITMLEENLAKVESEKKRDVIEKLVNEIKAEINYNNIDRLGDFQRLADDMSLSPEQKLSLAISGWLLGAGSSIDNAAVAQSLITVRSLVAEYLVCPQKPRREEIVRQLLELEGGTPNYVAKILLTMKPAMTTPGLNASLPNEMKEEAPEPAKEDEEPDLLEKPKEKLSEKAAKRGTLKQVAPPTESEGELEKPVAEDQPAGKEPVMEAEEEGLLPANKDVPGAEIPGTDVPKNKIDLLNKKGLDQQAQQNPQFPSGYFELKAPGLPGGEEVEYAVQLPPEYDPYRRYPVIVTLSSCYVSPRLQIAFWAGPYDPKKNVRLGQAGRHGYIVVSPLWHKQLQSNYEYSLREHAAVLNTLRDCAARFAIDSDKVFLTGHDEGANAAWDIGQAHPDLWAGVIPIGAKADKYISHYKENAEFVPFYFVFGHLDGVTLLANAGIWDYMLTRAKNFDCIVTEYQQRGNEPFGDEILMMYDWMNLHRRNFYPQEVEIVSMRPWDNFFWSVELQKMPESSMVMPVVWNTIGKKPLSAKTRIRTLPPASNGVTVTSAADDVTVWLSPDSVDFARKVNVTVNNKKRSPPAPSSATILEDARTRGDRQHPFWAKSEG